MSASWEDWIEKLFIWMPYVTLAASAILAQFVSMELSERLLVVALALVAALWTWLTFTRLGPPLRLAQRPLRIYFAGFVVLAALLVMQEPVFLIYGVTGFVHSALLRPWPLAFLGMGATAAVVHSHIVTHDGSASSWAIFIGVVAIQTVAVGAGMYAGEKMMEVAEARRRTLEELERAMNENLGLHAQLVAQAREAGILDERQRMAREIHDTIAQGLTGVITQIEAVHQSWNDEAEVQRHLDNASSLARESLAEARRSVEAMRPASLDESRLPGALKDVAMRWSEISGVPVEVHTTGDRRPLRPEVEVTLLRVAQEGLANIAKHAGASRAGITLSFMDGSVTLDVRDDGAGFDIRETVRAESFGLAAMRQRVEHIHGIIHIESELGDGTAISVSVPESLVGSSHA